MRQDGSEVRYKAQDCETAHEGGEGGRRADVYTAEDCANDGAEDDAVERVFVFVVYATEEVGGGRGVVAG